MILSESYRPRSDEEIIDESKQLAPYGKDAEAFAQKLAKRITTAGAIFLGPYSPTTVGDYVAGPSHVLPTGGSGRAFSGLGLDDFVRRTHFIAYTKKALERMREPMEHLTTIENMPRHFDAVKVRLTP